MMALIKRLFTLPLVRFAMVGVGNMIVDIVVLGALRRMIGIDLYSGQVISFLAAATFGFFVNRKVTFSISEPPSFRQWAHFIASQALGGGVNYAVYVTLVATCNLVHTDPALGIAAGAATGLLFNYLAAAHFVFKKTA